MSESITYRASALARRAPWRRSHRPRRIVSRAKAFDAAGANALQWTTCCFYSTLHTASLHTDRMTLEISARDKIAILEVIVITGGDDLPMRQNEKTIR